MNLAITLIIVILALAIKESRSVSFVVLGDLHIDGTELKTLNLRHMVREINRSSKEKELEFVIIVGDLTKRGKEDHFKIVKKELDQLEIPYLPCVGNHDTNFNNRVNFESTFREVFEKVTIDHPVKLNNNKREWNFQNFQFQYESFNFIFLDFINMNDFNRNVTSKAHPETLEYLRNTLESIRLSEKRTKGVYLVHHHPMSSPVLFVQSETDSFPHSELIQYEYVIHQYLDKIPFKGILTGHFHVEHSSYPINDLKQWVFSTMDFSMIMKIGTINEENGDLSFIRYVRNSSIEIRVFYIPFDVIGFVALILILFKSNFFTKMYVAATSSFLIDLFLSFQSFFLLSYIPQADCQFSYYVILLFLCSLFYGLNYSMQPGSSIKQFGIRKIIQVKLGVRILGLIVFYYILVTYIRMEKEFVWVGEKEISQFGSRRIYFDPMFRVASLVSLDINIKIVNFVLSKIILKKKRLGKDMIFVLAFSIASFTSLASTYFIYTYWVMVTHTTFLKMIFGTFTVLWMSSYLIPS